MAKMKIIMAKWRKKAKIMKNNRNNENQWRNENEIMAK